MKEEQSWKEKTQRGEDEPERRGAATVNYTIKVKLIEISLIIEFDTPAKYPSMLLCIVIETDTLATDYIPDYQICCLAQVVDMPHTRTYCLVLVVRS